MMPVASGSCWSIHPQKTFSRCCDTDFVKDVLDHEPTHLTSMCVNVAALLRGRQRERDGT